MSKGLFRVGEKRAYAFLAALIFLLSPIRTHAVTYTWDAVSGNGVNDDGAGVWTTTTTQWTTDNGLTNVLWVDGNDAIIGSGAGAAGTITIGGALSTKTVNSIIFNAPISGNYIINGGTLNLGVAATNLTTSNNATINSILAGTGGFNKLNAGTLTITATNTYSGATVLTGGILSLNKLQNGGTNSSLGSSSNAAANLRFVGGNLTYTGIAASTDRLFTLSNNGTITQNGTGVINWTNTGLIAHTNTAVARTLTLTGTQTGNNTFAPLIGDASPALTSVTKSAAGRWLLTNTNTYTGITTFGGGILTVSTLTDGGVASPIGAASAASANLVFNTGVLEYTGPTVSTNRGFTFTGAGTVSTTNNLTISGVMTGAGALTKAGLGTLTLTGTNTRTGATTMTTGTVSVATIGNGGVASNLSAASTASGNIVFNGGTLQYTGITSSTNRGMTFTGAGILDIPTATLTMSGIVAGAGRFTKTGAGAIVMTGANTRSGILQVDAGTFSVSTINIGGIASALGAASAASGNIILNGGVLQYTGVNTSTDRGLTFNSASVVDITTNNLSTSGILTGSGNWSKNGIGTLSLSGTNTFTGAITLNQGMLSINGITNGGVSGALGAASTASANLVFNGGALQYTGATASTDRGATFNATAIIDVTTNNLTTSGVLTGVAGLTKIGNGTLTLTGVNTFTGATTFATGTVSVATIGNGGVAGHLGAASNASANLVFTGGTLQYTGATASIDRGATFSTASTGTIDITTNTLTTTGVLAGAGHLVKTGGGILVLGGSNSYTGNTWITAGELQVNGSLATGPVRVDTGTLSGSGVIGGSVTLVNSAGSKIQGGTGTGNAGTLTIGAVTFGGVLSKLQVNTNGVTPSKVVSTGAVSLNGMTVDINGVLPDGTYDLIDAASLSGSAVLGNYSTGASGLQNQLIVTATKLQLVVDTTADAAPGLADLQTGSDTGLSSTDDYTADTTPTFDIACITGSTVKLYSTTTLLGSGLCVGGVASITSSVLTDGIYNAIQSTQTDGAGNASVTSTPFVVTIDTLTDPAPGIPDLQASSDTGSLDTDDITTDSTPTFDISCVSGDWVELYDGATFIASSTCIGGIVAITTATLSDGVYTQLRARQIDLASNVSAYSASMSVEVDTSADAAPGAPDLTTASDTGASNTDNITSDATPSFVLSCVSGSVVSLWDGITVFATSTCVGGTATITPSLVDGSYSLTAFQTDTAGNQSLDSAPILVVIIDTTVAGAPGTPDLDTSSDTGSSNTDDLTNDSTPSISVSCETGDEVRLYATNTLIGFGTCIASTVTITTSALLDGVYNLIQAVQEDTAGNISVTSSALLLTIDTSSPSVTINQGPSQPDPTNNPTSTFRIIFSEPIQTGMLTVGDIDLTASTVSSTVITSLTEIAPMDGTAFELNVSSTGFGVISPFVHASAVQDIAGNSSLISTSIDNSVTYLPFAASAPLSLTSVPGNGQVTLNWLIPASNGGSSITNYLIQYRQTGTTTFTTYSHPTSTATTITIAGLTNGISHEIQVAAITLAGAGAFSQISSATPVAPVVIVSSGGGGGGGGGGGSFTPPVILPDTGDTERVKAMNALGYAVHDLVKLPDDGNLKTQDDSAVYYLGADGRRHAFPDPKVYNSWYCDFSRVKIIPVSKLAQIPLGKNVTHRPGLRLVKFPTMPTVYLVQSGRVLRAIQSEQQAIAFMGTNWAKKVSDISETFYLDYSIGSSISEVDVKTILDQSSSFVSGELYITGYTDERVLNVSALGCATLPGALGNQSSSSTSASWPYKELQPGFRFTTTLSPGDAITQENRALQEILASLGNGIYPEAQITGKYGAFTAAAVNRFQVSKGLNQTNSVGPSTRLELNKIIASKE